MARIGRPSLSLPMGAALLALFAVSPAIGQFPAPGSARAAITRAQEAMVTDPAAALAEARRAERLSVDANTPENRDTDLATALWLQSEALLRSGQGEAVGDLVDRGLAAVAGYRQPLKVRGDLLLTRGGWQVEHGLPAQALASFQEAHREFARVREPRSQAMALQNIALLYTSADDFDRAIRYYDNAADTYSGDPKLNLFTSLNRGVLLHQMERYDEAIIASRDALRLANRIGGPGLNIPAAANLARTYLKAGNAEAASAVIADARRGLPDDLPASVAGKLDTVEAQVALKRGDLDRASTLIGRVFDGVDLDTTPVAARDAHFTAYTIYSATGQTALALRHLAAERRLATEASRVAISTGAALMAARFDFANQELRIANLKAAELRQSVALERQRAATQRWIFGLVGGAAALLLALLSFGLVTIRRSRNEVRDANIVLGETNVALERALRAKTEFLATTSHEIRTPLNGILGMTQVMLADGRIDDAMRERIGVVHGAGQTMRALVDDILDVAKMETGNLTVDPVPMDLPATLREVCRIWEEQARAKGLSFRLDLDRAPDWIESDPDRLRQIIFNLLSNALKFTASGTIGVAAAREGDRIVLSVSDSGIGIPADRQHDIFESFRQVDAGTTRQYGGTGLGLTICRNLAVALGGDVEVESVVGQGSTFHVRLPYRPVATPAAGTDERERCGILVLDRNPIARSMLKAVLEPRCGSVLFVTSVDALLGSLDSAVTDRVLIDDASLGAEEDDMLSDLHRIVGRTRPLGITTTLLWSAKGADRDAVIAAGIDDLVERPITAAALAERVVAKPPSSPKLPLVSRAA